MGNLSLWCLVQFGVMVGAGVSILAVAAADFWRSRDCDSALLMFWVAGTFLFTGFVNWGINARSILPMVPAVGILMVRRIERGEGILKERKLRWGKWLLIPAGIAAMVVCWSDYSLAGTARSAAQTIDATFNNYKGRILYQGHWGFQYYMDAKGYKAVNFEVPPCRKDIIITPKYNTHVAKLSEDIADLDYVLEFAPFGWVATMSVSGGAGFYSDIWGGLAFVVDNIGKEKYYVFTVK